MEDDRQHASRRDDHPDDLREARAIAEEQKIEQQHQCRNGRLNEQAVRRRRILQPGVHEGIEAADPDHAEQQDDLPIGFRLGPVPPQVTPGQRQGDDRRPRPAQEGQRERRHLLMDRPRHDGIAGP